MFTMCMVAFLLVSTELSSVVTILLRPNPSGDGERHDSLGKDFVFGIIPLEPVRGPDPTRVSFRGIVSCFHFFLHSRVNPYTKAAGPSSLFCSSEIAVEEFGHFFKCSLRFFLSIMTTTKTFTIRLNLSLKLVKILTYALDT